MNAKLRLTISILTGIVIYLIPAILWFLEDLSGAMVMFLYTMESIVTVVLAIVTVLILAPQKEEPKQGNYNRKSDLIKNFLIISSGFGAGAVLFVSLFVFLFLNESLDVAEFGFALTVILVFQMVEFLSGLFLLRPLTLKKAEF
ncbi:MAG: hypothetical protein KF685_13250, partial [Acidobacteria bacterium]|nr:hypothetical protein [Acidobacteriota bacterium]